MKKTLRYGYKLSNESISEALFYYDLESQTGLHNTRKEVMQEIKKDRVNGNIPKNAKPTVFKIVVEIE